MSILCVGAAGPATTIQDLGRRGWQRYGVTTAGAMDPVALRIGNVLVGNPPGTPAIELVMQGGSFSLGESTTRIALTGADMPMTIDGSPAAAWRSHRLQAGQTVRIGPARDGVYAYLALAGGFALAPVLGSFSTHLRSAMGGFGGRALQPGDELPLAGTAAPSGGERRLPAADHPRPRHTFRVVPGPQDDYYTSAGMRTLLTSEYVVSSQADRMGIRLSGPPIEHAKGFNIISDGIAEGSIQVPGAGEPIVLLADRQSTGGYPKIATVISVDVAALAQCPPGTPIRFAQIGIEEAQRLRRERDCRLAALPGRLLPAGQGEGLDSETLLSLTLIDGVVAR